MKTFFIDIDFVDMWMRWLRKKKRRKTTSKKRMLECEKFSIRSSAYERICDDTINEISLLLLKTFRPKIIIIVDKLYDVFL
jgi:hypothetical protein